MEKYRNHNPICRIHKMPMHKRGVVREGQERFFCPKCEEAKHFKMAEIMHPNLNLASKEYQDVQVPQSSSN